jgi:hypothetical protein
MVKKIYAWLVDAQCFQRFLVRDCFIKLCIVNLMGVVVF